MIIYIKGDILKSDEKVIAHGVNTKGVFGAGIAGQIALMYPMIKEAYMYKHTRRGWYLGDVQLIGVGDGSGREFANCATQDTYGKPENGPHVSYVAIREVMKNLATSYPHGFAIPKIGAGLAGGDWDLIEQIINEECALVDVRVYVL